MPSAERVFMMPSGRGAADGDATGAEADGVTGPGEAEGAFGAGAAARANTSIKRMNRPDICERLWLMETSPEMKRAILRGASVPGARAPVAKSESMGTSFFRRQPGAYARTYGEARGGKR